MSEERIGTGSDLEVMKDDQPTTVIFPQVEQREEEQIEEQVEEQVEEPTEEEDIPLMVKLLGGHWLDVLDGRQKNLIKNCRHYATGKSGSPAGLPGHNLMLIISIMADTLDRGFAIADAISEDLQAKFVENRLFESRLADYEGERLADLKRIAELEVENDKLQKTIVAAVEMGKKDTIRIEELEAQLDGAWERNQGEDL